VRNKYIDPLESIGWLSRDHDDIDKRVVTFEKCRIEPEKDQTIGVYEASYFKGIYPEEKLKEYLKKLEKIWNKKRVHDKDLDCTRDCSNGWFYTEKVPYFLEQNSITKVEIKDENTMKNESSTNPYNLEETKDKYKVSETNLIEQYDEETVLLQIPQDDTRVGDVTNKFKNQNKAADTIVVLQEKKKVITGTMDGQSYIRRLSSTPRVKDLDVKRSRHNTLIKIAVVMLFVMNAGKRLFLKEIHEFKLWMIMYSLRCKTLGKNCTN